MKLLEENIPLTIDEILIVESLNLNFKTILELGCGDATMTKKIATNGHHRDVIACDIDEKQHNKNLKIDIENLEFILSEAQDIPLESNTIDFVFMFKSFHHIPKKFMTKSLSEIKRVLKPKGMAYICEPLHMGKQKELIEIFHNEEKVRIDAFNAIKNFVDKGEISLFKEFFFQTPIVYDSFKDFEKKHMNHQHNDLNINDEIKEKVKKKYEEFGGNKLTLLKPFRVDILQKNR